MGRGREEGGRGLEDGRKREGRGWEEGGKGPRWGGGRVEMAGRLMCGGGLKRSRWGGGLRKD